MTWPTRDNSFECFYIPETDSLDHCRSALKAFASVSGWWYWRFYAFPHSAAPHIPEYAPLFQRWAGITFISSGTEMGERREKHSQNLEMGLGRGWEIHSQNSATEIGGYHSWEWLGTGTGMERQFFPRKVQEQLRKMPSFFLTWWLLTPPYSLLLTHLPLLETKVIYDMELTGQLKIFKCEYIWRYFNFLFVLWCE